MQQPLKILKFSLTRFGRHEVPMPRGCEILSVQPQDGVVCIWAMCDPDAPMTPRMFEVVGTGWDVPPGLSPLHFLATCQTGTMVWHVFEVL